MTVIRNLLYAGFPSLSVLHPITIPRFSPFVIPFYVLIDKEGKVVAKWEHIGDVQLKELDMLIK